MLGNVTHKEQQYMALQGVLAQTVLEQMAFCSAISIAF